MTRPVCAWINLEHLRHNYRLLKQQAGPAELMAIVKANAYGHGMALISSTLHADGCRHFGVTDAREGVELRQTITDIDCTITLLSGIFDVQDARDAATHRLTPAIINSTQISLLKQAGFDGDVWIKVDTGMNRLGADDPAQLVALCRQHGIGITGVMSHLSCADMPEHPLNRMQVERFDAMRQSLCLPASLLNSAGMITLPQHGGNMVRPGIALYGVEPVPQQPLGLKPVMQLSGQIIHIRNIRQGDCVSYAASFQAQHDMRIGIVALGYADGIPRRLSGKGHAMLNGHLLPIVGRICMDYTILDISGSHANVGDNVEFWGSRLYASDVACIADTIAYELFTGVGDRVPRRAL